MGSVLVCGGGVIGLSLAMMLSRDGHAVTVLEADPDGPPLGAGAAWESWHRRGVSQFRQPHNLFARAREVWDAELPEVTGLLLEAGCVRVDPLAALPRGIADRSARDGDDRLRYVTGRRPVVESVVATAAEEEPGLTVRRGVRVTGLLTGSANGLPHVTGVATDDDERVHADLVVDATGRRMRSTRWLAAMGARDPAVEQQDSGFVYHTRFFTGPVRPERRAAGLVPMGSISVLTLDGDNDTWSVTVYGASRDAPLRALRSAEVFDRVVRDMPRHAHWLDGRPVTGVLTMAGVLDARRELVVDGEPVAAGLVAVGDAWACTNPSAGRGISLGLMHAQLLRRSVAEHLDDPVALARSFAARTEQVVTPYYRDQLGADAVRRAEMVACAAAGPAAAGGTPADGGTPDAAPSPMTALAGAASEDPDAFRALIELLTCLAPSGEVLARPEIHAALERHGPGGPHPVPGPDRARLLQLLAG
jgi:2-polyprenyl-6-methoxyphenol hydroxylase-like FAD-dependent oxidoreductase